LKRVMIVSALLVWTGVIVLATAYWMLVGTGAQAFRSLFPVPAPMSLSIERWMHIDDEPWMLSRNGMVKAGEIHAKREILPDGIVRLVIDDANGFSSHTVTIDLSTGSDGAAMANAMVDWIRDAGKPSHGTMSNLVGHVGVDSINWTGEQPLVVSFDLHGQIAGAPSCVHGEVSIPR
jgi:hypothetical protein